MMKWLKTTKPHVNLVRHFSLFGHSVLSTIAVLSLRSLDERLDLLDLPIEIRIASTGARAAQLRERQQRRASRVLDIQTILAFRIVTH
jgi:hypothetical protein